MRKTVLGGIAAALLATGAATGVLVGSAAAESEPASVPGGDTKAGDTESVPSRGVVRSWDLDRMQGVIDSDDVPGGCHVTFAAVAVDGFPALPQGQQVEFEWYRLDQPESGLAYECSRAWPAGQQPYVEPRAFRSRAWTIHADGSTEEFTGQSSEPVPAAARLTGHTTGTVRMWNDEEGWGVIDSAQTPGGCWAHYSNIVGHGFRTVTVGAAVTLDWEQVTDQDGYRYRATRIEQHRN
ncbi:cold-shock protein [Rhodococcus aetherivorans]|uniref:cold-shock protein n=1 Tax=Rhodococcus aetherivorans TaxID=191292 RepID=UPI001E432B14|nr:cold shock domain-containing protein [Rhodococcus aetherivorans]UGQ42735.1 cold shock domain-containing protein [Rhodococcus aetherivorans]